MDLKESETVELKRSTSELKEALHSISAMLNKHQRGEVYFGVRNNGSPLGQTVTERTLREISKTIGDHVEPKIYPKIEKVEIGGKPCVHVTFNVDETPYLSFGRA